MARKGIRMRRVMVLALLVVVVPAGAHGSVNVGHSGWNWGNPQPQGSGLAAITFADGVGYAAGDFGTVLRTTDSGVSWTGRATGTRATLTVVRALNARTVFA